ncbi:CDC73 C-terminal domain-containing protein [Aspergillus saccharolyticus JOP 1030-1]|uniref:CDC73-domain-containing protein n=1 Tax=Aspergillus saccharolyticus JOP 1030-1 TaxID=1450539 RepID=A0A318ZCT5_9EURO|nr:CDC73-domain-containing protein [Aspergillus saccharolyticus JOP 1030-1]PYH45145.1 CDC73-domain-containing protein [Aspergillus saccharolyticus JOP 1030-1]
MATNSPSPDPLLALRQSLLSNNPPKPTTSSSPTEQPTESDLDLARATHLYFAHPTSPQTIPLNAPTRFVSSTTGEPVDLRSIFFAWLKKDVAIPEYIAEAEGLNQALKEKRKDDSEAEEKVQNLVFVERLDLLTWLEGASEESEYIKPLEGEAAAKAAAAAAAGGESSIGAQAQASTNIASGATGGVAAVPSGSGVGGGGAAGATGAAAAASGGAQQHGRAAKVMDPRLQEIYNGERKMGDRNSVLRGIKPTDFSHVRKTAETFLGRTRSSRTGQYPPGVTKPGSKPTSMVPVPAPSAGLSQPRSGKSSSKTQDPIILLSPSASSLIRMSNVRSFLGEGVFIPPDHPTLATGTNSNILYIHRPLRIQDSSSSTSLLRPGASAAASGSRKPTRFILVDSTANFRPDYWNRLVAVFTTGQTWQFKSYKWSSPPELFKHATGIYVGWRGEDSPREVRNWGRGVQSFSVERWDEKGGVNGTGRWRDREVVEGIWSAIEEGMRLRGWGGK